MAEAKTNEDILRICQEKVAVTQIDAFRIKLARQASRGAFAMHVATFEDAPLDCLGNMEVWVPQIAGGGPYFQLEITHAKDPLTVIGRLALNVDGQPRHASHDVLAQPGWVGPKRMTSPVLSAAKENIPMVGYSVSPGASSPVGGSPNLPALAGGPSGAFVPPPPAEDPRVTAAINRLEQREKELTEWKHREELEAVKRRAEERIQALEQRTAAAAAPKESNLLQVVSVFAPLVQDLIKSNNEVKAEMARRAEALAERQMQQQLEAQRQMQEVLKLAYAPKEMDTVTKVLVEKAISGDNGAGKPDVEMMSTIVDSFSKMTKMTMSMAHAVAESQSDGEPPSMMVMREATKALQVIVEGFRSASRPPPARRPLVDENAALPPPAPAPQAAQPTKSGAKAIQGALDKLEQRIRDREDPVAVASAFLDALALPEVQAEMAEHGGSVVDLFNARLGDQWLNSHPMNQTYVMQLMTELKKQDEERRAQMGQEVIEIPMNGNPAAPGFAGHVDEYEDEEIGADA